MKSAETWPDHDDAKGLKQGHSQFVVGRHDQSAGLLRLTRISSQLLQLSL